MSVSLRMVWPRSISRSRRTVAFSMMPLWTSANRSSQPVWGWALAWVGAPWVAHRVCAIPIVPWGGSDSTNRSSSAILPGILATWRPRPLMIARPAESYPRYSIRRSPPRRMGAASFAPT